jgi:hypothetical protein
VQAPKYTGSKENRECGPQESLKFNELHRVKNNILHPTNIHIVRRRNGQAPRAAPCGGAALYPDLEKKKTKKKNKKNNKRFAIL